MSVAIEPYICDTLYRKNWEYHEDKIIFTATDS